jgi:predicted ArsR family transcriptional regulator
MFTAVPRAKRAEPEQYGEIKNRYQFMLTGTSSDKIDELAEKLGITRSEVLEKLIRLGGLSLVLQHEEK